VALQDAPTTNTHWSWNERNETYTHTVNFTGPCTLSSVDVFLTRIGYHSCMYIKQSICTSTVATVFAISSAIPDRFRPSTEFRGQTRGNSGGYTNDMTYTVATNGNITVYANVSEGNFGASGGAGWYGINYCHIR